MDHAFGHHSKVQEHTSAVQSVVDALRIQADKAFADGGDEENPSTPPRASGDAAGRGLAKLGIGNSDAPTPERRITGKRAAASASPGASSRAKTPQKHRGFVAVQC
eukprot:2777708-Alexandrium_andersonii.AAC.1